MNFEAYFKVTDHLYRRIIMNKVKIYTLMAMAVSSMGLYATDEKPQHSFPDCTLKPSVRLVEEGNRALVIADNNYLWTRDTLKMSKAIASVVWKNKKMAAQLIASNPIALPTDCYKAVHSTLYHQDGSRVHGLNEYLNFFATKYDKPEIMDTLEDFDQALSYVIPNYNILGLLQQIDKGIYIVSSNDRATEARKMAVFRNELEKQGLEMPLFKDTLYVPESKVLIESGKKSLEGRAAIEEWVRTQENDTTTKVMFSWDA